MQRTIQDFQNLLSGFNDLHQELIRRLDEFNASIEPGVLERLQTLVESTSQSSNGERIHLLAAKKSNDKQKDKASAAELARWYTPMWRSALLAGYNAGQQFNSDITYECLVRDAFYTLLRANHDAVEGKFLDAIKVSKGLASFSNSRAASLLEAMQMLVDQVYPELEQLIPTLSEMLGKVELEKIAYGDKALQITKKVREDNESIARTVISSMPPMETLKTLPISNILTAKNLERLIEGTEWGADFNRRDSYRDEVDKFRPQWQALAPVIEKRKMMFDGCIQEYKAIDWLSLQREYDAIQAEKNAVMGDADFAVLSKKLVKLITPLLKKNSLTENIKQQQKSIEGWFDELIERISRQSQTAISHIERIDLLIKSIPADPLSTAHLAFDAVEVLVLMRSLHERYRWLMEFTTRMDSTASEYGHQHAMDLLAVLKKVVSVEAFQTICQQAGVKLANGHAVAYSQAEMISILSQGMSHLEEKRNQFAGELKKIGATNKEVNEALVEMDTTNALRDADILFAKNSQSHHFAHGHNFTDVEKILNFMQENVLSETTKSKTEWLKEAEWEVQFKRSIYEAYPDVTPRLTNLKKCVAAINVTFKLLSKYPPVQESNSAQYNRIVETYNKLMESVKEIVNASNKLLDDDANNIRNYMFEFEKEVQSRISEACKFLRTSMECEYVAMNGDIAEIAIFLPRLEELKPGFTKFSPVLPRLQELKSAFQTYGAPRNKRYQVIQGNFQPMGSPLKIIPVSLIDIQTYWLDGAMKHFERSYHLFLSEENKRKAFVKDSFEWAEMLRPNYLFLNDATKLWEEICCLESDSKKWSTAHQKKSAELSAQLNQLRAQFLAKEKSNQCVIELIRKLKAKVLGQLAVLDQSNPYSLAMVKLALNEMLQDDAETWRMLAKEKEALKITLQPNNAENSNMLLADLRGFLRNFHMLTEGAEAADVLQRAYLNASGVTDMPANIFKLAKVQVSGFFGFIHEREASMTGRIQKIKDELIRVKDRFYGPIQQCMAPVEAIKAEIVQQEKSLKVYSTDVDQAADNLSADAITSIRNSNTPKVVVAADIAEREEEKAFILDDFKKMITDAVKNFIFENSSEDQQPKALIATRKTKLSKELELITHKVKRLDGLNERYRGIDADLLILKNEKDRLARALVESQQKLLDGAAASLKTLEQLTSRAFTMLHDGVDPLRKRWKELMFAYRQLDNNVVSDDDTEKLTIFLNKSKRIFTRLRNTDNLGSIIVFLDNHDANCIKLKTISRSIVEQIDMIRKDEPHFMRGFQEMYSMPVFKCRLETEDRLMNFCGIEMQKVLDMYQWLLDVNARIVAFKKLIMQQTVTDVQIAPLSKWVERYAMPFVNAYKRLLDREKQINELEAVMLKLTAEQTGLGLIFSPLTKMKKQSGLIAAHLEAIDVLEKAIDKRIAIIDKLKQEESLFIDAQQAFSAVDNNMLEKVRGNVFQRFKLLFLTNSETQEILAGLQVRADKNKNIKPANEQAITVFLQQLQACDTHLLDLVNIIQIPLQKKTLIEGVESFMRGRGGISKTCELIQRLDIILTGMIKNHRTVLYLKDIENTFVKNKKLLSTDVFADPGALDPDATFNFFYTTLETEIETVKTKQADILSSLRIELIAIKSGGDNELTKLEKVKAVLEEKHQAINGSLKREIRMFLGSDSKLGLKLKEQIERLNQILVSYSAQNDKSQLAINPLIR